MHMRGCETITPSEDGPRSVMGVTPIAGSARGEQTVVLCDGCNRTEVPD